MTWQHACWPKDQHETLIEIVRDAHDGVLPEWAIVADLVYHADNANHPKRPVPFPGRRVLEKRWGVSERVARRCLADSEWQDKCDSVKIRRPSRHLDTRSNAQDVPAYVPRASPPASPPVSPPMTMETTESVRNVTACVPATVPPASPPTSTRALLSPTSSPPTSSEEEQASPPASAGTLFKEMAPLSLSLELTPPPGVETPAQLPKAQKAKRPRSPKTPDTAWSRQMADRWTAAFGPGYAFDWFKDRQSLARAAGAVGVELNQPLPEAALDHLQRAMAVYIAAARRDDPTCWPKGTPTIGGFVVRLSEWVMKVAHPTGPPRTPHDGIALPLSRRGVVEQRLRPLLDRGDPIATIRAQVAASTRLNPDERDYAFHLLDQHASKAKGVPR
jgi:hypothetical protein